jgi:hypothetical protein
VSPNQSADVEQVNKTHESLRAASNSHDDRPQGGFLTGQRPERVNDLRPPSAAAGGTSAYPPIAGVVLRRSRRRNGPTRDSRTAKNKFPCVMAMPPGRERLNACPRLHHPLHRALICLLGYVAAGVGDHVKLKAPRADNAGSIMHTDVQRPGSATLPSPIRFTSSITALSSQGFMLVRSKNLAL